MPVYTFLPVQMELINHLIVIDRDNKMPVYRQISHCVITAIKNGNLRRGEQLPGTRELGAMLGVHRKTVIAAYEELASQDWISVSPKKRVTISERIPVLRGSEWSASVDHKSYFSTFSLPLKHFEAGERRFEQSTQSQIVIDDGYPDMRLSPVDSLLKTYRAYTKRGYAVRNATIGNAQGTDQLRTALASYLSGTRGLQIDKDNLLITHGAQMSIYLASRVLLDSTATVVVGRLNYAPANKCFEAEGARVIEIGVDEKGMMVDELEAICRRTNITAVYVIPHHHYPTTVTLSVERRVQLMELARLYSFAIIEDDYDFDYHYTAPPYLPLAGSGHDGNIIYIGSVSKILGPSIRMGFMVAPKNFIESCTSLRKLVDVSNDIYLQNALADLLKSGELVRHVKKAKKIYQQRMEFLDALLKKHLSGLVSYKLPTGGMALWVKLSPACPIDKLISHQMIHIKHFDVDENAFRLGFASSDFEQLQEIVIALKAAIE